MSFLWKSSIGRKLVMSISGLFLVLFLLFHMGMNLAAVFSADAYNMICAFLGANWYALAGTLVLAAGVAVHFIYASVLTLQNFKARGSERYAISKNKRVSWASRNMFVIGVIVLLGLCLHLIHFWSEMQLVELLGRHENSYGCSPAEGYYLIAYIFSKPLNCAIYLVWFAAIWFHLTHGVWSAIHTLGWNNNIWYNRVKAISNVVATLIILGFAFVVVYFFITNPLGF